MFALFNKKKNGYNIKGENNRIIIVNENGISEDLHHDMIITGLTLEILGSNNIIKIHKPFSFFNSYFKISGSSSNTEIIINSNSRLMLQISAWGGDGQKVYIGKNVQMTGLGVISLCDQGAKVEIMDDCLIAAGLSIWAGDGHTLYDIKTNQAINLAKEKPVKIGNHCWICSHCTFLKGASIADNCVIGTRALITKKFEKENCVIAGNPASYVRYNINWDKCRAWQYKDK